MFENAIERLFYLDHFRVGGAILPQKRVRARMTGFNITWPHFLRFCNRRFCGS